jgi:hypothetical protein
MNRTCVWAGVSKVALDPWEPTGVAGVVLYDDPDDPTEPVITNPLGVTSSRLTTDP